MDITKLSTQSIAVIEADPCAAIQNSFDYGWAVPDSVVQFDDLVKAHHEIFKALKDADTPALDRVLAAMAAHDPEMEDTNV